MDYNYSGQYSSQPIDGALSGGVAAAFFAVWAFMFFVGIIFYIYYAICLMKIAKKTGTPNGWFAWIPILNVILMLQIAQKPIWWIILFLIPLVNIIMSILVWMKVAEAVGKPGWIGILVIVPVANVIVPGYLAFSKMEAIQSSQPQAPQPPQPAMTV